MLPLSDMLPVLDCENLLTPVQIELSSKLKAFSIFLFKFWKLHYILNILKKKMIVIPILFRKLLTMKDLLKPLSKKHRSRKPFDSEHVKLSQFLVKCALNHFHVVFSSL